MAVIIVVGPAIQDDFERIQSWRIRQTLEATEPGAKEESLSEFNAQTDIH